MDIFRVYYEISFANIQLFGAVLPSYRSKKKEKKEDIVVFDGNNTSEANRVLGL